MHTLCMDVCMYVCMYVLCRMLWLNNIVLQIYSHYYLFAIDYKRCIP